MGGSPTNLHLSDDHVLSVPGALGGPLCKGSGSYVVIKGSMGRVKIITWEACPFGLPEMLAIVTCLGARRLPRPGGHLFNGYFFVRQTQKDEKVVAVL